MAVSARIIAITVDLLILMVLVGLFVRRRWSVCYAFTAQQAFLLVADLMMYFAQFYTKPFWAFREIVSQTLTIVIALELTYKTFRAFPGARATARAVLFTVLSVTLFTALSALLTPASGDSPYTRELQMLPVLPKILLKILPVLLNGAIWLFTGVAGLILWYRLPVDAFLKAILMALVPYNLVYMLAMKAVEAYGLVQVENYLRYSDPIAYMVMIAYWAWAAWRPFRAPVRSMPLPGSEAVRRPA
jgi:hypothetical protein